MQPKSGYSRRHRQMDSTSRGGVRSSFPQAGGHEGCRPVGGALWVSVLWRERGGDKRSSSAHGALAGTYVGPSTRSACFASALERLRQSLEEVQGVLVLHNERDFTRYLLYKKVVIPQGGA